VSLSRVPLRAKLSPNRGGFLRTFQTGIFLVLVACGGDLTRNPDGGNGIDGGNSGDAVNSNDTNDLADTGSSGDVTASDGCLPQKPGFCVHCDDDTWQCGHGSLPQCPVGAEPEAPCSVAVDFDGGDCVTCRSDGTGLVMFCSDLSGSMDPRWQGNPTSCSP
jgi:hypothetical protein